MNAYEFQNALRIMRNIGPDELHAAHVIDENWGSPEASNRDQVLAFLDDPYTEAIRMPDANFEKLFTLIGARNTRTVKAKP